MDRLQQKCLFSKNLLKLEKSHRIKSHLCIEIDRKTYLFSLDIGLMSSTKVHFHLTLVWCLQKSIFTWHWWSDVIKGPFSLDTVLMSSKVLFHLTLAWCHQRSLFPWHWPDVIKSPFSLDTGLMTPKVPFLLTNLVYWNVLCFDIGLVEWKAPFPLTLHLMEQSLFTWHWSDGMKSPPSLSLMEAIIISPWHWSD